MAFFSRIANYLLNEVLVNTLANRCGSVLGVLLRLPVRRPHMPGCLLPWALALGAHALLSRLPAASRAVVVGAGVQVLVHRRRRRRLRRRRLRSLSPPPSAAALQPHFSALCHPQ